MSLCICKLKKSYHLSGKKQRKNCICHSHKCSKLYCRLCKSVCPFSVSTSDTLCHMHLSTHSSHSCKSLRKPGKHTSNIFWVLVCGLFWKRAGKWGALLSMIGGTTSYCLCMALGFKVMGLHQIVIGITVAGALMMVGSLLGRRDAAEEQRMCEVFFPE